MQFQTRLALSLSLAIGLSISGQASAVLQSRGFSANATSDCQSALPVFDGQIRKRPLAVQNEGSSNAFVTCSFTRQTGAPSVPTKVYVAAFTVGGLEQSITCTFVAGTGGSGAPPADYVPKTILLDSSGQSDEMLWQAADFPGGVFPQDDYSVSCNLLPGVALGKSLIVFSEDIGQ